MKDSNVVKEKSYKFALNIISVVQRIQNDKNEYVLSKQLMRSGTSIEANVEEAIGAQSRKDFLHKISVAYKEARETNYWIRLLKDSNLIHKTLADKLLEDCLELLKILGTIQKSTKNS
jgi:four helix bundle protein